MGAARTGAARCYKHAGFAQQHAGYYVAGFDNCQDEFEIGDDDDWRVRSDGTVYGGDD